MSEAIHEECGVFGIFSPKKEKVAIPCYYGLYALQHRGQESCGIAVCDENGIKYRKDEGLVNEVFNNERLERLGEGFMAMGHVRYGTMGMERRLNAQPLVINHCKGSMALAHNGALSNAHVLRNELELKGSIFHTTSDTEVIAYKITEERLSCNTTEDAICAAMNTIKGAYSLVVMSGKKLIAVRDPNGFRPLCIGKKGEDIVVASESCALDSVGAEFIRDIQPGEIVVISDEGISSIKTHCDTVPKSTCVFEYIYFARPDSVIDGSSVHTARIRAGSFLALEHPVQADVVIGVPDSGIDAAIGYSRQSGIPYSMGFIKNKYIGRTFIQPGQKNRENLVNIKLNPIKAVVENKRVVLIDDSIVRGTTSARIVKLLRNAGAKEVHIRSSAPPFKHPCYFGTDIDSRENLIANNHSLDEIKEILGVDSIGYLSCENVLQLTENSSGFCRGCFTGEYPSEIPVNHSKGELEANGGKDE